MEIAYTVKTDVLVIGAGGAGIKAAIKAGEAGAKVLLASKFSYGRTGASFYPGMDGWGINAITHRNQGDSEDNFFDEIIDAGAGCADPRLARVLVEECTPAFREMERYGIDFAKDENGEYKSVISCFGKRVRGANANLGQIRRALWIQLMRNEVDIRGGVSVVSLAMKDGACIGALAFDEQDELFFINAGATVLATGGGCGIYRYSLATPDQTGDGYIFAFDAGAKLTNLEFLQFIPGLTWPVPKLLFQEKNLDTCPSVTNRLGEEILPKYLPPDVTVERCLIDRAWSGPFSHVGNGRYFDIAMYEEWLKGNVLDSGGIHMKYAPKVMDDPRWPIVSWREWMASRGVNVVDPGFDIIPHAQCYNGGIYINPDASTGVPGLYAAGETAGGPHGADRLGGNAQAATQVFGNIAGRSAAKFAQQNGVTPADSAELMKRLESRYDSGRGGVVDLERCKADIREAMWLNGAIVRSEERCDRGLAMVQGIDSTFNPWVHIRENRDKKRVVELYSYINLARLLLTIMKERRESRGPHYRSDYPESRDEFKGMMVAQKDGDGIKLTLKSKYDAEGL